MICKEELQKFASTLHKTLSMTKSKNSQEGHTNLLVAADKGLHLWIQPSPACIVLTMHDRDINPMQQES